MDDEDEEEEGEIEDGGNGERVVFTGRLRIDALELFKIAVQVMEKKGQGDGPVLPGGALLLPHLSEIFLRLVTNQLK